MIYYVFHTLVEHIGRGQDIFDSIQNNYNVLSLYLGGEPDDPR